MINYNPAPKFANRSACVPMGEGRVEGAPATIPHPKTVRIPDMGETYLYQPLTPYDRVSVVLYRIGIVISTCLIFALAALMAKGGAAVIYYDIIFYGLYASIGVSVIFIHLYVRSIHGFLKTVYSFAVAGGAVIVMLSDFSPALYISDNQLSLLLSIPLAGCLGFITAKEAFCFRLFEGYLLAMFMPVHMFFVSLGVLSMRGILIGLYVIVAGLVFFTLRKTFQPIHFDIGDKSAYR